MDVDRHPRFPKAWWYGYNAQLTEAADRFLQFLFAPDWRARVKNAPGALLAVLRGHRV